jgi:hypothetical protein
MDTSFSLRTYHKTVHCMKARAVMPATGPGIGILFPVNYALRTDVCLRDHDFRGRPAVFMPNGGQLC